ncbi:DUF188 domain-containing protein [Halomonas maura]|uniref:DUF188 domain-containing protein n=1 Tax=Halomonas maura TaxID=117606 RepID=UPI003F4959F8
METLRASGEHTGGPKGYSDVDRREFANALDRWLARNACPCRICTGCRCDGHRTGMEPQRASGEHTGGPKGYSDVDRREFANALDRWLARQRYEERQYR